MKCIISLAVWLFLLTGVQTAGVAAQPDKAIKVFKNYINSLVQRVEQAQPPEEKRAILENSFDEILYVLDRVESLDVGSERDKKALTILENNIRDKKNELNGLEGFRRVPDGELNNFANYVQQDLEQADDTVTITISATLLVIILVLLLLL